MAESLSDVMNIASNVVAEIEEDFGAKAVLVAGIARVDEVGNPCKPFLSLLLEAAPFTSIMERFADMEGDNFVQPVVQPIAPGVFSHRWVNPYDGTKYSAMLVG